MYNRFMNEELQKGEIIIYTSEDGSISLDTKLENDTIWLTQKQMAELFDKNIRTVNEHINNIFKEGELDKSLVIRNFRITASDGKQYDTNFYNLDVIISVGYRVKSLRGTQFRIWATNTLREYLTKGYVINEKMLKTQQNKIQTLQSTVNLLKRSLQNQISTVNEAQDIANIMDNFAQGLDLLDDFDHKTLDTKGITRKEAVIISKEEYLSVINKMKSEFVSDVFANPKDDSFDSSINQIYQTFGGQDCYPTLEEKAAMLLYLITKNYSFSDGNKRIAASCFLYFLNRNNLLYKNNLPIIDNGTLFALTLLIAESKPEEMEIMKQIVVSVLNNG